MDLQLKQLRIKKGYSQDEMASLLGIKTSRYGTWERGDRSISFSQAISCADILGCTLDELAGRDLKTDYSDDIKQGLNKNFDELNNAGKKRLAEEADWMARSGLFAKSESNSSEKIA